MKMKMLEHFAKLAKTDIATAEKIIEDLGGIRNIGVLGIPGLARHPKLTQAKAEAIHHGIQLGRLSMLTYQGKESITSPEASYNALKEYLYGFPEERFAVLFLNRRRNLITKKLLTIGSEAYTIVDPRQIFHYAVGYRASALILGHNHPSGNPRPSQQDMDITNRLKEIGSLLQIPILDHLIIGDQSYISFKELGLL